MLYSEDLHCMVDVFDNYDFKELEKISADLTLKETTLEAQDTFASGYSFIGGGAG